MFATISFFSHAIVLPHEVECLRDPIMRSAIQPIPYSVTRPATTITIRARIHIFFTKLMSVDTMRFGGMSVSPSHPTLRYLVGAVVHICPKKQMAYSVDASGRIAVVTNL